MSDEKVEEIKEEMEAEFATSEEEGAETETSLFLQEEEQTEGFLPEASDEDMAEMEELEAVPHEEVFLEGTELDAFESAEIEDVEFVEDERLESIIESILFASDRPVSLASLKLVFKGTNVRTNHLKRTLDQLAVEYAGGRRGVTLEEVPGGYQLRTKMDNMEFLRRTLKARSFKLSGPALEVLSITAYKQPIIKAEIDEIRGVESGHLLRALMEKNLVCFEGKSELPGRPMQYGTTRKFLEIFGLRNLKELPTLSQIDELLPEGIDEEQAEEKQTLASITDSLSETIGSSYSQGEEELMKIQNQLEDIATTTTFFEEEKRRQAEKRDEEKAQNIREALALGEPVSTRDSNWLVKYDEALAAGTTLVALKEAEQEAKKAALIEKSKPVFENPIDEAIAAFDAEAEDLQADDGATESMNANELEADADVEDGMTLEAESEDEETSLEDELPFFGEADDIDEEGDATL